jgi:hypothetical protein
MNTFLPSCRLREGATSRLLVGEFRKCREEAGGRIQVIPREYPHQPLNNPVDDRRVGIRR